MSRHINSSQASRRLFRGTTHDHPPSLEYISPSQHELGLLVQAALASRSGRLKPATIAALVLLSGLFVVAGTGCTAAPPHVTPGNLINSATGATIGTGSCINGPSNLDIMIAGANNSTITASGPITITDDKDFWNHDLNHLTIRTVGTGYEEPASVVVVAQAKALLGDQTQQTTQEYSLCVDTQPPQCTQTKIGWMRERQLFTGEVTCHEVVRMKTGDFWGTYTSSDLQTAWAVPLGMRAGTTREVDMTDVAGNQTRVKVTLPLDFKTQPSLLIDRGKITQEGGRLFVSGLSRDDKTGADMEVSANGALAQADPAGVFELDIPLKNGATEATVIACAPDNQCVAQTIQLSTPYHPFQGILADPEYDPNSGIATLKLRMTGGSQGNIDTRNIQISGSQGGIVPELLSTLFPTVHCEAGQATSGDEFIARCNLPIKDWPASLKITIPDQVGNKETITVKVGKDFTALSLLGLILAYGGGLSVVGAAAYGTGKVVQEASRRERRERNRVYFNIYRNKIIHGQLAPDLTREVSFYGVDDLASIAKLQALLAAYTQLTEAYTQMTNGRVNKAAYALAQGFNNHHELKGYIAELYHELVRNINTLTCSLDNALLADHQVKQKWEGYKELIELFKILLQQDEKADKLWREIRRYELEAAQEFQRQPKNAGKQYVQIFTRQNIMRLIRGYAERVGDKEMILVFRS